MSDFIIQITFKALINLWNTFAEVIISIGWNYKYLSLFLVKVNNNLKTVDKTYSSC